MDLDHGLALHLGLIALIDFADLSLGMVMLHLFTFDPAWVPAVKARTTETLFYDGRCGLCHKTVRFLIAEDRAPVGAFRFGPLGGETFQATVPRPSDLPDSLIVLTDDERILTRSRAALHLGRRLGGLWRVIAGLVGVLPVALLDRAYDAVAHFLKTSSPRSKRKDWKHRAAIASSTGSPATEKRHLSQNSDANTEGRVRIGPAASRPAPRSAASMAPARPGPA